MYNINELIFIQMSGMNDKINLHITKSYHPFLA